MTWALKGILFAFLGLPLAAKASFPHCENHLLTDSYDTAGLEPQFAASHVKEILKFPDAPAAVEEMLAEKPHWKLTLAVEILKREKKLDAVAALAKLIEDGYRIDRRDGFNLLMALARRQLAGRRVVGRDFAPPLQFLGQGGPGMEVEIQFPEALATQPLRGLLGRDVRGVQVKMRGVVEGDRWIVRFLEARDKLFFLVMDERRSLPYGGRTMPITQYTFYVSARFLRGEEVVSRSYESAGLETFDYLNRFTNRFYSGAKARLDVQP